MAATATATASNTISQRLEEIRNLLEEEEFEKVVEKSRDLLFDSDLLNDDNNNNDNNKNKAIRATVKEIYAKCLVVVEDYDTIKKKAAEDADDPALLKYAQYRLEEYKEAAKQPLMNDNDNDNELSLHVQAQALYRLHQTNAALDIYQKQLQKQSKSKTQLLSEEDRMELLCNALAVANSNSTPLIGTPDVDHILQNTRELLQNKSSSPSSDPAHSVFYADLAYNLGTNLCLNGQSQEGIDWLQKAHVAAKQPGQQDPDLAHKIQANLAWATEEDVDINVNVNVNPDADQQFTAKLNQAKSLAQFPKNLPKKATPTQRRVFYYNKAVLSLHANRLQEAKEALQALQLVQNITSTTTTTTTTSNGKKKKASKNLSVPPACTIQEEHWWNTRAVVIEASIMQKQGKDPKEILTQQKEVLLAATTATSPSNALDSAMALLELHLASNSGDPVEILQKLPESIRKRKAVVATLALLYQQQGRPQEDIASLLTGSDMGDFFLSQGRYDEAEKVFQTKDDETSKLKYIQCLTHTNPKKAQDLWNQLGMDSSSLDDAVETMDGEELETRELPRVARRHRTAATPSLLTQNNKEKSRESVLRKRAKNRQAYIEKLQAAGKYDPSKPPNPERWIPKYERSRYRNNNRKGPHKGAQGGVSEKEAAKLDIVGRAAGNYANVMMGPSSAHISVSNGGNRKGGRRR